MVKAYALLNLLSVIVMIAVNYASQALRLNDTTIGAVSRRYNNLFTPADYAFSIWGLIFLGLLCFGIFQVWRAFSDRETPASVLQIGPWFLVANVLNIVWVLAFVHDFIGLSVLVMFGILCALLAIVWRTNMERWDAPLPIIAFVWWPICLYSGWIAVATIANVAAYLTKLGWSGGPLTEVQWTLMMIGIAVGLNCAMIWKRNMREFAAVGIWALLAICLRHWGSETRIAYAALAGCLILLLYAGYHGFKNRKSNPLYRLFN